MAKKNNLPASDYAKPHTMSGKPVGAELSYEAGGRVMERLNVSVAGISKGNYAPEKKDGVKIRGTGAATKGLMARGPMA
jgi:hypothetical protein